VPQSLLDAALIGAGLRWRTLQPLEAFQSGLQRRCRASQHPPGHALLPHTYWFLVPLADHHTVSYLQRQFGNSILVTSLLQPANH
jgi:hypothetical protein